MENSFKTNRRKFILGSAVATSAALNYSSSIVAQSTEPYRAWEDLARKKWTWDSVTHSTHGTNCTGQCAFNVYVKNGVVWREEQQGESFIFPAQNQNLHFIVQILQFCCFVAIHTYLWLR